MYKDYENIQEYFQKAIDPSTYMLRKDFPPESLYAGSPAEEMMRTRDCELDNTKPRDALRPHPELSRFQKYFDEEGYLAELSRRYLRGRPARIAELERNIARASWLYLSLLKAAGKRFYSEDEEGRYYLQYMIDLRLRHGLTPFPKELSLGRDRDKAEEEFVMGYKKVESDDDEKGPGFAGINYADGHPRNKVLHGYPEEDVFDDTFAE